MKLHPLKFDPLSVSRFYRKGHRLTQWMNAASLFGVNVFFYPFTPGFPLSIRSLLSCTHKPHKRGCPSSRHSSHVWHHRGQPRSRLYRQQWRPANDPVDCQWPSAYPYFTGLYFINGTYSDSTKGTLVTQLQMALAVWDWLVCARGVCFFLYYSGDYGENSNGNSGMEPNLEERVVNHQIPIRLDTVLWNCLLCT